MSSDQTRRPQDRTLDGVLAHLREYLSLRLVTALKLAPKNAVVLPQIVQNQLESLHQVLQRVKVFGTDKSRVVDILVSEDDLKRKAVLSTSDNNSILVDLLNTGGDKGKKMAEFLISDARTHITHIDPALEKPMLLVQHYIWWDLPDAAELYHYEEKLRALAYVRANRPLPDDMRARFRAVYRLSPDAPLTDEQILANELKGLEGVLFRFNLRRAEEEPYQNILAPAGGHAGRSVVDRRLQALVGHIANRDSMLNPEATVDPAVADQYAALLGVEAGAVTRETVLQYEEHQVASLRAAAVQDLLVGDEGESINYKQGQLHAMRQRVEAEKAANEGAG